MELLNRRSTSTAEVLTKKLKNAKLVWKANSGALDFVPNEVFCCPQPFESNDLYSEDHRIELADRYGGIGCGDAAGSGRCSSYQGVQTKGVGPTTLIGPKADKYHSSGLLSLSEASLEAIFSKVYSVALPFGAVPTIAVVLTGGTYIEYVTTGDARPALRALAFRPLVARPAHFLRNVLSPGGRLPEGTAAPGLTRDAMRTREALRLLASSMKHALELDGPEDKAAILDQGLRELARRIAWQCAAGFARRLPHGSLCCSNISLSGQYLDFGVTSYVPNYRRRARPPGWQDTWSENRFAVLTLTSLRQQLAKYAPEINCSTILLAEELVDLFSKEHATRLKIEMAKMAGLTEDLASRCPRELLESLFNSMRSIWERGANERFVSYSGWGTKVGATPAPRAIGRYKLNQILSVAGANDGSHSLDRALVEILDDDLLRSRFVRSYVAVRQWLCACNLASPAAVDAYIARQSARKNADLPQLDRTSLLKQLHAIEAAGGSEIGRFIDATTTSAARVLQDLDPDLTGHLGAEQLKALEGTSHPQRAPA